MPWRWILAPALVRGFFVPLDAPSIQALLHRFTLLELPTASCPGEDDGSWHPHCAFGLADIVECEYTGYQYSMEWYFIEMLRDNLQYLADPEEAEFVYFPHCVSQLYFALKDTHNLTHWQAIERAELQYLVPMLRWAHRSPLHAKFGGRNFWTVFSMDLGRQDFPRSGAWLQRWSVGSLTGSPTWMADNRMLLNTSQMNDVVDCWELDTAPVVFANEMFPARTFRAQDTVISIPSRFSPHPRSRRFGGRPVLAFFAGSPNSCARERILALLSNEPGFDVSTSFATGNEEYRERMWRARFCFVLRGSSHTNNGPRLCAGHRVRRLPATFGQAAAMEGARNLLADLQHSQAGAHPAASHREAAMALLQEHCDWSAGRCQGLPRGLRSSEGLSNAPG
ncbi:unnamed protein product [Effrenium voratum]|nr:unnamed protein product [Effrenium voratum]